MIDLSILIVNWNTRELVVQCLESLAATTDRIDRNDEREGRLAYGQYSAEVVVVDNASTDGSAAMIRDRFPWARLIENEQNVGFAPANNQAQAQCSGRYVLLLNSDTVTHQGAIQALLDFMESHPACGAGGARMLNADGSLQPSCQPMLTPWREFWRLSFLDNVWRRATYNMARWDVHTPREVEVIHGACLIIRRTSLPQGSALLDERYFMYTEEIDLCYRLATAGWKLNWIPEARVTHFGGASSRQAYDKMYVQLYRSKVQFYRKFGGEARARRFKSLVKLAYWPRYAAARLAQTFWRSTSSRAQTFNQLLIELPEM